MDHNCYCKAEWKERLATEATFEAEGNSMGNISSDPGDTHPEAKPGPQDVVANRILEVVLNQAIWQRLPRLWLKGNSQTYRWQALRPKTEPLDSCEFSGESTDWEEWMEQTWLLLNPMRPAATALTPKP